MVLTNRREGSHNTMLGRRVPHPPSTNFKEESLIPPAKRLKTFDSTDGDGDASIRDSDNETIPQSPKSYRAEIPDSEEDLDSEDDEEPKVQKVTELESALAPVKTDKEAIAEYEAMRQDVEHVPDDLKSRLVERKWTKGKTSIYVDAFNLALDTVLEDEGHLFDEKEQEVFKQWRALEYEQQYL